MEAAAKPLNRKARPIGFLTEAQVSARRALHRFRPKAKSAFRTLTSITCNIFGWLSMVQASWVAGACTPMSFSTLTRSALPISLAAGPRRRHPVSKRAELCELKLSPTVKFVQLRERLVACSARRFQVGAH